MQVPVVRLTVALVVSVLGAIVTAAITWGGLPDRLATHWTIAGRPDGEMSRSTAAAVLLGLPVVLAALTVLAHHVRVMPYARRAVTGLGLLLTVLLALDAIFVFAVNAAYGGDAQLVPLAGLVVVAAAFAVVLVVLPGFAGEVPGRVHVLPASGANVRWRGTATSRWAVPASLVCVAIAALAFLFWTAVAGVAFLVAAVAMLSMVGIVVEVDDRALWVRYFGGLRWPASRIPLTTIRQCRAIRVNPAGFGGWGYRGSLRLYARAAVNLRRGDALQLELDGGRRFVVTVDDAAAGCEALRSLVR